MLFQYFTTTSCVSSWSLTFLMSSRQLISGESPPCTHRNCWLSRAARGRQSKASIQASYTRSEYLILPAANTWRQHKIHFCSSSHIRITFDSFTKYSHKWQKKLCCICLFRRYECLSEVLWRSSTAPLPAVALMIVSRQFLPCHLHNTAGQIRAGGSQLLIGQEQPEHSQDSTMGVVKAEHVEYEVSAALRSRRKVCRFKLRTWNEPSFIIQPVQILSLEIDYFFLTLTFLIQTYSICRYMCVQKDEDILNNT